MGAIKYLLVKNATESATEGFSANFLYFLWLVNYNVYGFIKRVIDIFISTIGLIILAPVMVIIAFLIKHEDHQSIFFKQTRTGYMGKEFEIIKFRTMTTGNDVLDKTKADEHTKIGTVLRKTSLDEIPQLINILKGDMSFIGPRPWIVDYYNCMNDKERMRTWVKPGITGLAQANGRNGISIFDKIGYDLEYVKNYSVLMDVVVILESVKAVISGSDADAGKAVIHNELNDLKAENQLTTENA